MRTWQKLKWRRRNVQHKITQWTVSVRQQTSFIVTQRPVQRACNENKDNQVSSAKKWIERFLPQELRKTVELDFSLLDGQNIGAWDASRTVEESEDICRIAFNNSHFEATVELTACVKFSTIVVQTTLRSTSAARIGLEALKPIRVLWHVQRNLQLRIVNGGTSENFFPPDAYKEKRMRGDFAQWALDDFKIHNGEDGRSSNLHLPVLQVGTEEAGVISALEWSGLWQQEVNWDKATRVHIQESRIPVKQLVLEEGEELRLPPVHLTFYRGDLDEGGNRFRRYVYEEVCPTLNAERVLPPIGYDHWHGVREAFDESFLMRQARRAQELGLEYFVVDAAWYAPGSLAGTGNWGRADSDKFPNGLEPLADYVSSLGLKLGLWCEFERAHVASDIYREHPEWFLTVPADGREDNWAPHLNAHLDLSLRPAQDWVIATIGAWIRRMNLKYCRWDYNFGPLRYWQQADPTGKKMFRHMEGLYRVLDTLLRDYPDFLIEGCASGGRRFDLGTIRRAHTYWFSDQTINPDVCRFMQSGANRFFPANLLNSAVTVPIGEGDSGFTDKDVFSRMLGALSFNGDIASWSEQWTRRVRHWVDWYRERRWLLLESFYPLTPQPTAWDQPEAIQFVSADGREALILAYIVKGSVELTVAPRGIRGEFVYDILNEHGTLLMTATGERLLADGIRIDLPENGYAVREIRQVLEEKMRQH